MRACACKYLVDVYDPALLGARELKMDQGESHDGTMIKLLLQLGADANMGVWRNGEIDVFYETALNLCFGDVDLMKCLLSHGADVVERCKAEVYDQDHVYEASLLAIACGINDIDGLDAHGGRVCIQLPLSISLSFFLSLSLSLFLSFFFFLSLSLSLFHLSACICDSVCTCVRLYLSLVTHTQTKACDEIVPLLIEHSRAHTHTHTHTLITHTH